jgi:hypothetical protein
VFAQTIELTLNETVGLSKIIMGPAVRKVFPHEVLIVRETILPLGQLKRVKVCGTGKFCDATGFEAL